jgi:hypothetical protein
LVISDTYTCISEGTADIFTSDWLCNQDSRFPNVAIPVLAVIIFTSSYSLFELIECEKIELRLRKIYQQHCLARPASADQSMGRAK